jgi:hypothetical protein
LAHRRGQGPLLVLGLLLGWVLFLNSTLLLNCLYLLLLSMTLLLLSWARGGTTCDITATGSTLITSR